MRHLAFAAAFVVLCAAIGYAPILQAEQENVRQIDVALLIDAQTIAPSGTYTSKPFKSLPKTTNHSVQVKGTGTAPNYKVEILCMLDGNTFVKPETGGDLGTFTDTNAHIIAVGVPVCLQYELKITELGGANSITITAYGVSQ